MQDQNSPSIEELNLSTRSYNCLRRAGLHTVAQVAALSDEELLSIRNLGRGALIDIRRKLEVYLSEHPLPEIIEGMVESKPLEAPPAIEPVLSESPSTLSDPTPLGVLRLSSRPYNVLMRAGINTIGQLAAMSREQIREARNIGEKSLAEIEGKLKAYLAVHPLSTKPEPPAEESKPPLPPPPLADPEVLNKVREKGIPLDEISVKRLALPESQVQILLHRANIETIGELALQPRKKWRRQVNIIRRLNRYLEWLVKQDEAAWANEVTGRDISPLHRLELAETSLEDLAVKWLSPLNSRRKQVIRWRYGIDGEELTLEEAGERLNITRERVRQIQNRARRALEKSQSRAVIRPLRKLLLYLLEQAGGLMNEAQLEAALRRELVIGDVDPVGVARLIFDLDDNCKWIREAQAWGLTRFPLAQVPSINRHLTEVLEKAHAPLPSDEVVACFKETRFYQSRRDALYDALILACLRAHPRMEVDEDGLCSLERWSRHRLNEMILALREIGEPAHYSVIAEKVNALLPPEQQTAPHNIHAELGRRTDLFVRVGRGIFGLEEWGLPDDGSLANAAYRVLFEAGRPLHTEAITNRVLETWQAERVSVHAAILNDDRFYRAAPATFGLMEWEIERLDEERPVLNICPPPLPDRRGERNTFFESVLVAREVLSERPTTAVFLEAILKWVGTSVDKSERYLQNVLNAYYVVGLIPYTVYRHAAAVPLCSTLQETDDLQILRSFCLDCMMERLARMPEFIALLAALQPCTRAELRDRFYEPGAPLDDVKNRVRMLFNLGMLRVEKRGRYLLTPLGMQVTQELETSGQLKYPASRSSWEQVSDNQPAWGVEFDMIDFEPHSETEPC